jgi:hypothetical protein
MGSNFYFFKKLDINKQSWTLVVKLSDHKVF